MDKYFVKLTERNVLRISALDEEQNPEHFKYKKIKHNAIKRIYIKQKLFLWKKLIKKKNNSEQKKCD